jgi:hypothetical protein
MLTVAAFESSRHDEKFKTTRNGNVKGTHPSPNAGEEWGTLKFKSKFRDKNDKQDKAPQDEVPEWYHLPGREVNCGKYGRERPGHPPANSKAMDTAVDKQIENLKGMGKNILGGAAGGAILGCVVTSEAGCIGGALLGGLTGALGGTIQGGAMFMYRSITGYLAVRNQLNQDLAACVP